MPKHLNSIHDSLLVTPTARLLGLESFNAENLWTPPSNRGVFGGQVIGQALMAAIKTVEGKDLHSQHCYFLLPCDSRLPVTYAVERLREGKSYATRLVHAIQESETIFILMASFSSPPVSRTAAPGDTVSNRFQKPMPTNIASFQTANEPENRWKDYVSSMGDFGIRVQDTDESRTQFLENDHKTVRPLRVLRAQAQEGSNSGQRTLWMEPRLLGKKPTPNEIRAMIGYMTDSQTVATASRAVGLTATSTPKLGMVATIDHTIHFYPFPPDYDGTQPILHAIDAEVADLEAGRGFVTGRVYTQSGVLIATTSQEGVVRAQIKGKKPRKESARL